MSRSGLLKLLLLALLTLFFALGVAGGEGAGGDGHGVERDGLLLLLLGLRTNHGCVDDETWHSLRLAGGLVCG